MIILTISSNLELVKIFIMTQSSFGVPLSNSKWKRITKPTDHWIGINIMILFNL